VPVLPDDLAARIHRRLAAPAGPVSLRAPGFLRSARYPLATAATLLVAVLIWMTLNRSRVEPVRPAEPPKIAAPSADADESAARTRPVAPPEEVKTKKSEPEKIAVVPGGRADDRIAREIESASGPEKNAPPPAVEERRDEEHKELDQAAPGASSYSRTVTPAPNAAAVPASPPPPPPSTSVVDKQSAKDAKKRENRSRGAGETAAESAAPARPGLDLGPHAFHYETEAYSATFTEDGLVTLVARGYACSVNVPVPPGSTSPPASGGEIDLPALFRLATSADFLAVEDGGSSGSAPGGVPATLTLRDGTGDTVHSVVFHPSAPNSAPPVLRKLDQAVQTLLRQTFRARLESRCGPIPPGALPTP
jgi:hypothetical protein